LTDVDLKDSLTDQSYRVTEARAQKLQHLAANRQEGLTLILENVHDPHNLMAVLRTCDSIGVHEIFALYTVESVDKLKKIPGHRSSSGAKKWVHIHYFEDTEDCFEAVRAKYDKVYGTHLGESAVNLYDLDLSQSVALMFGNERRGISDESLALLDGNLVIPQVGLTQSLNISVACAVTLYEAKRQRLAKGMYAEEGELRSQFNEDLYSHYLEISRPTTTREPK